MVENGFLMGVGKANPLNKFYFNPNNPKNKNPHFMMVGGSGSGKTTIVRKIIESLRDQNKDIFVIDFHGDLRISGENLLVFSPRNSENGVNPFEITIDEKKGGVRIQSKVIASMMGEYFMDNIGKKQQDVLEQLIIDTYALFGIFEEDYSTWNRTLPTMVDLEKLCRSVIHLVNDNKPPTREVAIANNLGISLGYFRKLVRSKKNGDKQIEMEEIYKTLDELTNRFTELAELNGEEIEDTEEIDNIHNAAIDIFFYEENKRSLGTLYSYIKSVSQQSIFQDNKPMLIKGLNRLDFSGFTSINQPLTAKFLAEFIAQKLFRSSMNRGEYKYHGNNGDTFDRVLIIDESKLAMPKGKEKDNPYNVINRIVSESRKYGLMLGIISQRLNHYSNEMLANVFTKIVLKVASTEYSEVAKALNIKVDEVESAFNSDANYPAIIEAVDTQKRAFYIENFD